MFKLGTQLWKGKQIRKTGKWGFKSYEWQVHLARFTAKVFIKSKMLPCAELISQYSSVAIWGFKNISRNRNTYSFLYVFYALKNIKAKNVLC